MKDPPATTKPRREDIFVAPVGVIVQAARGQLLAWRVRLRNVGRLPVTAMHVNVVFPATPGVRPGWTSLPLLPFLPNPPSPIPMPIHFHMHTHAWLKYFLVYHKIWGWRGVGVPQVPCHVAPPSS